jgi:hypothetical protein
MLLPPKRSLEARRRDVDRVTIEVVPKKSGHLLTQRMVDAGRMVDVDAEPLGSRELDGEHLDVRRTGGEAPLDLPL